MPLRTGKFCTGHKFSRFGQTFRHLQAVPLPIESESCSFLCHQRTSTQNSHALFSLQFLGSHYVHIKYLLLFILFWSQDISYRSFTFRFLQTVYLFSTFSSASHSSSFCLLPFPFIHSISPLFLSFPWFSHLLPFLTLFFLLSLPHLWWWVSVIELPLVELLSALRVFKFFRYLT